MDKGHEMLWLSMHGVDILELEHMAAMVVRACF